jgi:hypothetical protein
MKASHLKWAAALLAAAPAAAQDASADARLRELERQNREILDRLRASEARNSELESKLGDLSSQRRDHEVDARVETEVNALSKNVEDSVNWKQLTRSGNPLKFYGFFRLEAYYNTARLSDQITPQWVLKERTGTGAVLDNDDEFALDTRLTRFGFDVNAGKIGQAEVTGKLETDFANTPVKSIATSTGTFDTGGGSGSGSAVTSVRTGSDESRQTPRIRLAYMNIDFGDVALRLGQDWDTVSPLFPIVNGQMLMWNTGNLGDRRPQATFMWDGGDPKGTSFQWKLGAGLTSAVDAADADGNNQKDGWDSGLPHVQTRFGISTPSWVDGKMLAGGVWGYYADSEFDAPLTGAPAGSDNGFESWVVGADLTMPLFGGLALRGEVFLGEGLSDLRGGIGQSYTASLDEAVGTWGGWLELEWKIDALTLAVGATHDNPQDGDLAGASARTRNWSMYFGTRYDFGGGLKVGVDVIYWETQYLDDNQGNAVRVNAYTMFEF